MLGESEVSFVLPRDINKSENIRARRALSHPWLSPLISQEEEMEIQSGVKQLGALPSNSHSRALSTLSCCHVCDT